MPWNYTVNGHKARAVGRSQNDIRIKPVLDLNKILFKGKLECFVWQIGMISYSLKEIMIANEEERVIY